jgi:hypothetical protein
VSFTEGGSDIGVDSCSEANCEGCVERGGLCLQESLDITYLYLHVLGALSCTH